MGLIVVTFPILTSWIIPTLVTLVLPLVNLVLSLPFADHCHCLLACALSHPLVIWYPTVYYDVTHFVVVDPLRQPLVSKLDRRPVGTLQLGSSWLPLSSICSHRKQLMSCGSSGTLSSLDSEETSHMRCRSKISKGVYVGANTEGGTYVHWSQT
jgi:hypothetical protein